MRILMVTLLLSGAVAMAEVRRAVLVGIGDYMPAGGLQVHDGRAGQVFGKPARREIDPLPGAARDAEAMREILIERFGFEDKNILMLPSPGRPATAANILNAVGSHLIDGAAPGDVSLFYFAGHGSRIRNTSPSNRNPDGMDSTIVPADALRGAPDIRSKELARLYIRAPQKGVRLTVIQDSCYSGAAARGPLGSRRLRAQAPDSGVWVNEPSSGPLPEDLGVLLLSASQEYEPAAELETTDLNGPHGAFTWALLHALAVSPEREPAARLFQRVRALMQSQVGGQEPVMLARDGRVEADLFGTGSRQQSRVTFAVRRVANGAVRLNAGLAANLHEGCELRRVPGDARIRVERVTGIASSDAIVIAGSDIKPGDLFELEKWAGPESDRLRISTGEPAPEAEIRAAVKLRKSGNLNWVDDPVARRPSHVIRWREGRWWLVENAPAAKPVALASLTAGAVRGAAGAAKPEVFLLVPPTEQIRAGIHPNGAVALVSGQADYVLAGRVTASGSVEYAWIQPDFAGPQLPPLPLRTDWCATGCVPALSEQADKLARVEGWLRLERQSSDLPFRLELRNVATGKLLSRPEVLSGERYKFFLRGIGPETPPRRIYLFVVDSFGKSTLVFGDNLQNEFPRLNATPDPGTLVPATSREADVVISAPFGIDNYYLLTTSSPIDNPQVIFNAEGVRTRGSEPVDPLARLLWAVGNGSRGKAGTVPANWSIERLTVFSRETR